MLTDNVFKKKSTAKLSRCVVSYESPDTGTKNIYSNIISPARGTKFVNEGASVI